MEIGCMRMFIDMQDRYSHLGFPLLHQESNTGGRSSYNTFEVINETATPRLYAYSLIRKMVSLSLFHRTFKGTSINIALHGLQNPLRRSCTVVSKVLWSAMGTSQLQSVRGTSSIFDFDYKRMQQLDTYNH